MSARIDENGVKTKKLEIKQGSRANCEDFKRNRGSGEEIGDLNVIRT